MTTTLPIISTLRLKNARSWKDSVFLLSGGVNVFTGESDSGKSNVVRCIRSLIHNETGDAIRMRGAAGPSEIEATFRSDSEEWGVRLTKDDTVNRYTVTRYNRVMQGDEEVDDTKEIDFDNVGRDVPQPVYEANPLSPIVIDGQEVDLYVAGQRDSAFLVDDPPAQVARVVGSVSGLSRIITASKGARDAAKTTTGDLKTKTALLNSAAADLAACPTEEEIQARKGVIERAAVIAKQVEAVLTEADQIEAAIGAVRLAGKQLNEAKVVRDNCPSPDAISKARACIERANLLHSEADELMVAVSGIRQAGSDLKTAKTAADEAQRAAGTVKDTYEALLATLTVCPTCNREMNTL